MSSNLPITKNWGSILQGENPNLIRALDEFYTDVSLVLNSVPKTFNTSGANPPASSDFNKGFKIGDFYIRTDTDAAWIMTSRTSDIAVTWTSI